MLPAVAQVVKYWSTSRCRAGVICMARKSGAREIARWGSISVEVATLSVARQSAGGSIPRHRQRDELEARVQVAVYGNGTVIAATTDGLLIGNGTTQSSINLSTAGFCVPVLSIAARAGDHRLRGRRPVLLWCNDRGACAAAITSRDPETRERGYEPLPRVLSPQTFAMASRWRRTCTSSWTTTNGGRDLHGIVGLPMSGSGQAIETFSNGHLPAM